MYHTLTQLKINELRLIFIDVSINYSRSIYELFHVFFFFKKCVIRDVHLTQFTDHNFKIIPYIQGVKKLLVKNEAYVWNQFIYIFFISGFLTDIQGAQERS